MSAEDLKFGLSDLVVADDLEVALDNDSYQDQANPAPPAYGNYNCRALSIKPRTNKEGAVIMEGNYPILTLGMVEIVEGVGEGETRKVGLFSDIKTKPYDRYGTPASGLGDLTRSYGTRNWRGLDPEDPDSGISVLKEAFDQNSTFAVQLDWECYDKVFVDAALLQLADQIPKDKADRTDDQKKLVNSIYNAGRIKGMKYFPHSDVSGKFSPVFVRENVTFKNPVTNQNITVDGEHRTLEARPYISRFYPKKDVETGRVKFGPLAVKATALKLVA
jgi:hypothetical protein